MSLNYIKSFIYTFAAFFANFKKKRNRSATLSTEQRPGYRPSYKGPASLIDRPNENPSLWTKFVYFFDTTEQEARVQYARKKTGKHFVRNLIASIK